MRAWRSFRVILNRKGRKVFAAKAFKGIVIEVYMRQFNILVLQRINIDTEAVILAGYFELACLEVLDGMIGASMAEFQFVARPA